MFVMDPWDVVTLLLVAMPLLFCAGVWLGRMLEREQRAMDAWALLGCDCTELCEMGPTCPGGMAAGLPGTGCWRVSDDTE